MTLVPTYAMKRIILNIFSITVKKIKKSEIDSILSPKCNYTIKLSVRDVLFGYNHEEEEIRLYWELAYYMQS